MSRSSCKRHVTPALVLVLLAPSVICPGCGPFNDVLNKFDAAIREVQSLRESIAGESAHWREQLEKSQLQLTKDVKSTLDVDLRDNIDKSIAEIGIEARCDFDFANTHLVAYLQGVENALKNKREQIKREGLLKGFTTADEAIADVIKSVGHLDPYICHTIPGRLAVSYPASDPTKRTADRATIEFVGYAMKRPAGEAKKLTLYVYGPNREPEGKEIPKASDLLAMTTSYKVTLESSRLLSNLDKTDTKLSLRWGDESLSEVLLAFTEVIIQPPPKITDIILHVGTTWDDKDTEIYFEYSILPRSGGKPVGSIERGKGELWPDPSNRKPDWRSFTMPINPDGRFTEAERLGYKLHVTYHSTKGDPNWNGRFWAEAVVEGGKIIPVLGETDDSDYPKKYRDRDYDFNK